MTPQDAAERIKATAAGCRVSWKNQQMADSRLGTIIAQYIDQEKNHGEMQTCHEARHSDAARRMDGSPMQQVRPPLQR